MGFFKDSLICAVYLHTIIYYTIGGVSSSEVDLNPCKDFVNPSDKSYNLPTGIRKYGPVLLDRFRIKSVNKSTTNRSLHCKNPQTKEINFPNSESFIYFHQSRQSRGYLEISNHSRFTTNGYFYDGSIYYHPDDYCIKTISDNIVEVQVCAPHCSGVDALHSDPSASPSRVCIPKCCAVDEVLVVQDFTCKKVEQGSQYWRPKLHLPSGSRSRAVEVPEELQKPSEFQHKIQYSSHGINCQPQDTSMWFFSDVQEPYQKVKYHKDKIRLTASPARVKPTYYQPEYRKWVGFEGDFCADGFVNKESDEYKDDPNRQVIMFCIQDEEPEETSRYGHGQTWATIVMTFISTIFLLVIVLIYMLLIEKQNLHGLTILSYSGSMFFSYVSFLISHIFSIFDYPILTEEPGTSPWSGACLSVAILAHFFFLTTSLWLTVMNFDLLLTLLVAKPVSAKNQQLKLFLIYSLFAWGVPLLAMAYFVTIDEIYRDPNTEEIVPDYAERSCFVDAWARPYFVYIPLVIVLATNFLLFAILIFVTFYSSCKKSSQIFSNNREKMKLFLKVFCVMGVAWSGELISWYYNNDEETSSWPWYIVVIYCFVVLQPVFLFFLFCTNSRILDQLENSYPLFRERLHTLRKMKWIRAKQQGTDEMEMTRNTNTISFAPGTRSSRTSTLM